MTQLKLKQKMSACFKVALAGITAISMSGLSQIATYADTTTVSPTSYSLSTYHDEEISSLSDYDQHVVLNLTFDDTVTIEDETALNDSIFGDNATYTITIRGLDITSSSYYRPCEYSASGKTLTIDMGNVMADSDSDGTCETAAFTAIYNGLIVAKGTLSGISVGGTACDVSTAIKTFIPNGVTLDATSGEKTNALTMKVTDVANVRSMYHFVVYNYQDGEYIPITADTGLSALGSAAYSLSSHAHTYYSMSTTTLATNIVSALNSGFIDGGKYSATDNGDGTFTINSTDSADKLVMYMYNDDFIQSGDYVTPTVPSSETISLTSAYATSINNKADGTGYYEYDLTASSEDAMPAWVANVSAITVGDITYTLTHSSSDVEGAYTTTDSDGDTTQYAYLFQDGDSYKLRIASYPLTASKSYTVKITNDQYGDTNFTIQTAKKSSSSATTTSGKKANSIKVKTKSKTIKAKLKKKKTTKKYTFKIGASSKTSVKVVKKSGNKKITVSKKGKVTVKKGIKKGTYKVKVKITAPASSKYKKATKTVTLKIKVKSK